MRMPSPPVWQWRRSSSRSIGGEHGRQIASEDDLHAVGDQLTDARRQALVVLPVRLLDDEPDARVCVENPSHFFLGPDLGRADETVDVAVFPLCEAQATGVGAEVE